MTTYFARKGEISQTRALTLYGGAYLNKGGTAIAYGTLKVLKEMDISYKYIIDPEPFPSEFFISRGLTPIYRYSDVLSKKPMPSISPRYTFEPFIKCLVNSYNPQIRQLRGTPIWHIGDSPFSDKRSSLSIVGQVIALRSLKKVIGGKVVIGGVSLGYPRTKVGEAVLRDFFKSIEHIFIRGFETRDTLKKLGVSDDKMTAICDFAYHLDKKITKNSNEYSKRIIESGKPSVGLVLRDYSEGIQRENYINSIEKLVNYLSQKGYKIYFIPTSYAYLIPENDQIFIEKMLNVDNSDILNIKDLSPEEIIHVFSNFDAIISTRLHGAVYGTLANVPTIHLYEDRKSLEVIRDIFNDVVPLIRLADFAQCDGLNRIIEILNHFSRKKENISFQIKSSINEARTDSINTLEQIFEKKYLLE